MFLNTPPPKIDQDGCVFFVAGQELLMPLTGSLYVRGALEDTDSVLINVGTGYYVEVCCLTLLLMPIAVACLLITANADLCCVLADHCSSRSLLLACLLSVRSRDLESCGMASALPLLDANQKRVVSVLFGSHVILCQL